ncbi:hypothetical protein [Ruegeria sp. HKCCD7318]|uniref:hypothetical protein n=1 Tax=Ruegeria sp. HKCCD7318 TaxID=2683014 RepID=UPI001C121160|nr:hypothetical protein [Ruegeria sp. HKCCD7318]
MKFSANVTKSRANHFSKSRTNTANRLGLGAVFRAPWLLPSGENGGRNDDEARLSDRLNSYSFEYRDLADLEPIRQSFFETFTI